MSLRFHVVGQDTEWEEKVMLGKRSLKKKVKN